jgi:hypothetical protein
MATRPQSPRARRWGYGIAALINLIVAWGVNIWPGWDAVPFLTSGMTEVLPLVNLSLLVGFLTNLAYLVADPPWFKALGNILTAGISIAVLVRTLRVFPFDFGDSASTWDPITRGILIFLIVASTLGLAVQVVQFGRLLIRGPRPIKD